MMHSVADVQGLNLITEQVLGNAAHALAGMIGACPRPTLGKLVGGWRGPLSA